MNDFFKVIGMIALTLSLIAVLTWFAIVLINATWSGFVTALIYGIPLFIILYALTNWLEKRGAMPKH